MAVDRHFQWQFSHVHVNVAVAAPSQTPLGSKRTPSQHSLQHLTSTAQQQSSAAAGPSSPKRQSGGDDLHLLEGVIDQLVLLWEISVFFLMFFGPSSGIGPWL